MIACAASNTKNLAILAGKDQDLGEMITISDADTNVDTLVGGTDNS